MQTTRARPAMVTVGHRACHSVTLKRERPLHDNVTPRKTPNYRELASLTDEALLKPQVEAAHGVDFMAEVWSYVPRELGERGT